MTRFCKSFVQDENGDCIHFASPDCRFVTEGNFKFACDSCIHGATRHVDPRCKTCSLKDQIAFPAKKPELST